MSISSRRSATICRRNEVWRQGSIVHHLPFIRLFLREVCPGGTGDLRRIVPIVSELLRSGATLSQIGQLLRHDSHDTARLYAKVDIEALRPLSLPWPGGVP